MLAIVCSSNGIHITLQWIFDTLHKPTRQPEIVRYGWMWIKQDPVKALFWNHERIALHSQLNHIWQVSNQLFVEVDKRGISCFLICNWGIIDKYRKLLHSVCLSFITKLCLSPQCSVGLPWTNGLRDVHMLTSISRNVLSSLRRCDHGITWHLVSGSWEVGLAFFL